MCETDSLSGRGTNEFVTHVVFYNNSTVAFFVIVKLKNYPL
jgi:hypothetical protein